MEETTGYLIVTCFLCRAWRVCRGPGQVQRAVGGRPLAEGEERAAPHRAPEEGHAGGEEGARLVQLVRLREPETVRGQYVRIGGALFTVVACFGRRGRRRGGCTAGSSSSSAAKRWLCRGDGFREAGGRGDLIRARNLAPIGLG